MSAFLDDHAKDMKDPEYAYQFGRNERELEIIKLLEDQQNKYGEDYFHITNLIALIKGEK